MKGKDFRTEYRDSHTEWEYEAFIEKYARELRLHYAVLYTLSALGFMIFLITILVPNIAVLVRPSSISVAAASFMLARLFQAERFEPKQYSDIVFLSGLYFAVLTMAVGAAGLPLTNPLSQPGMTPMFKQMLNLPSLVGYGVAIVTFCYGLFFLRLGQLETTIHGWLNSPLPEEKKKKKRKMEDLVREPSEDGQLIDFPET